ncbi:MAG: phosphate--acyl-ACP acyltransferase, partial [Bacteroidota bacterium]
MAIKIGIDVMGGDYAPLATIEGANLAKEFFKENASMVLIGDEATILNTLKKINADPNRFEIVHASQIIAMHEHPTKALVQKPDSSIGVGLKLLKEDKIQAFSSAGNTGAALVGSMQTIRAVQGVIRPCITSVLPKENGGISLILDVGTNADCKPDVLYQFGILGSVYCSILT